MTNGKKFFQQTDFWVVTLIGVFLNIAWGAGLKEQLLLNSNLLPGLRWSQDSALYVNDLLQQTFAHNYSFHYLLPFWLAKIFPIKFILALLFLSQNFLGVYAIYYFAKFLFNKRSVGYLSLFFLFPGYGLRWALGASAPFGSNIFPDLFAIPLLLFCLLFFMRQEYTAAFLLLGITFNFHGAHTAFILCMFTFYALWHWGEFDKRALVKNYLLFSLCTIPLYAWMFLDKVPQSGSLSAADWILFTQIRRSHHSYPFAFGLWQWEPFLSLFGLLPLAWLARPRREKQAYLNSFLAAIIFMMIIGTLFTEIWPIPTVVKFSFFRSTRFFVIVLYMYLANFTVSVFKHGSLLDKSLVFIAVILCGNLNFQSGEGGNAYLTFFVLLALSCSFLVQSYYPRFSLGTKRIAANALVFPTLMVALLYVFFTYIKSLPYFRAYPVFNLYLVRISTIILFWIALLIIHTLLKQRYRRGAAVIVAVVILLGTSVYMLWPKPMDQTAEDWYELQVWFSQNTPKAAMVLNPPKLREFRSFSGRSGYVSWFDADFLSYMPFLGEETVRRLRHLGYDFKRVYAIKPVRGWGLPLEILNAFYHDQEGGLTYQRLRELSLKEHIDYIVTERGHELFFPQVYRNNTFQVYKLPYNREVTN